MPFGQRQIIAPRQRPQHLEPRRRQRARRQPPVPVTTHFVEDDASHHHVRPQPRAAQRHRRRRLRLARNVQHQHHWPAGRRRDVGRCAGAPGANCRDAVEQAHHAFADTQVRPRQMRRQQSVHGRTPHRPAVKIDACPPRRRRMERRVNVIRPAFERLHLQPARPQRRQQPQRHRRLAAARTRRGNDEAGGRRCCGQTTHAATPTAPPPSPLWGGVEGGGRRTARTSVFRSIPTRRSRASLPTRERRGNKYWRSSIEHLAKPSAQVVCTSKSMVSQPNCLLLYQPHHDRASPR